MEGEEEDIFIPAAQTNGALHKDTVQITLSKNRQWKAQRGNGDKDFIQRNRAACRALMKKVKTLDLQCRTIRDLRRIFLFRWSGQRERFPGTKLWWRSQIMEKRQKAGGKVVEIIGHINDPGTDIMSIVKGYDLPVEFPKRS